ncbi:unnamed protein product [Clonostachys chloroleuca]|uniref:Uncharacterized protein n=1 Tax=Clonostachys chloroleuca TaxID=1926264 RepID=A0AA35LS46_9HYPO|nr:unnamed protein product [Clonostachys chloroleuca]
MTIKTGTMVYPKAQCKAIATASRLCSGPDTTSGATTDSKAEYATLLGKARKEPQRAALATARRHAFGRSWSTAVRKADPSLHA